MGAKCLAVELDTPCEVGTARNTFFIHDVIPDNFGGFSGKRTGPKRKRLLHVMTYGPNGALGGGNHSPKTKMK